VRLSESFWEDARNGTTDEKLQFVLSQLASMTAESFWFRITTLELRRCEMNGKVVERLAGMLAQCPSLTHLDLRGQRGLQECCGSAQRWLTSISAAIG